MTHRRHPSLAAALLAACAPAVSRVTPDPAASAASPTASASAPSPPVESVPGARVRPASLAPPAACATASAAPLPSAPAARAPGQRVGAWGLTIATPPGATSQHEAAARRHTIHLGYQLDVELHLIDAPAPATLDEARRAWDQGDRVRSLGEGQTPDGVLFGLRVMQVREGFPAGRGQHVHHLKDVSRVYATLDLGARRHVECTGYVEHGADSADDDSLRAVADICRSMRRAP